ncbi:MAG: hypothetical protein ACR2LU_00900 [Luteitalea sp.]
MTARPEAETALAVCDLQHVVLKTSHRVIPLNASTIEAAARMFERADTSGHGLLIPTHEAPGARVSLLR